MSLDGWFTALDGSVGLRGLPTADVNVSALDTLEHLEGAFAGSFQATGDSWLLYSDFMWAKISADANVGPFGGNVGFEQEQILFTALVGYELPVNVQNMQLYATGGLRYQHYSIDLSIDPVFFPGTNRDGSQSWSIRLSAWLCTTTSTTDGSGPRAVGPLVAQGRTIADLNLQNPMF
ncbi:hypothetical protein [Rhizobium herbae]|jgi:hypothetical protein